MWIVFLVLFLAVFVMLWVIIKQVRMPRYEPARKRLETRESHSPAERQRKIRFQVLDAETGFHRRGVQNRKDFAFAERQRKLRLEVA